MRKNRVKYMLGVLLVYLNIQMKKIIILHATRTDTIDH